MGQAGEQAAADYLCRRGATILAQNFTTRFAEIDMVAQLGDTVCFVEVKTRKNLRKGRAGEAVNPAKQRKIIMAAQQYLKAHKLFTRCRIRFDVVEILFVDGRFQITHIPNAFQAA